MSERKNYLVQIVTAAMEAEGGIRESDIRPIVKFACSVLEEIDAVCAKSSWSTGELAKAVADAVAAERERCAKIAEELFVNRLHGDEIAAEIRRGEI